MSFLSGVGEGEFDTVDQLEEKFKVAVTADVIEDTDAKQIIGLSMHYPAQMSRSFSPIYVGK